jgi:hypothetical protein
MMATALDRATCGGMTHRFAYDPQFIGGRALQKMSEKSGKKISIQWIASNIDGHNGISAITTRA